MKIITIIIITIIIIIMIMKGNTYIRDLFLNNPSRTHPRDTHTIQVDTTHSLTSRGDSATL